MTEKIKKLLGDLRSGEYKKQRIPGLSVNGENYSDLENHIRVMRDMAELEKPLIYENDSFGFNRYTDFRIPERSGNVTPGYERVISLGFDKIISEIEDAVNKTEDTEKKEFGNVMLGLLSICLGICEKYRDYAKETGNGRLYNALCTVPRKGARSFYEALVFMKICIYVLRLHGVSHLTLGRFDQYMYPFFKKDRESGATDEELLELIEEFFISLNRDTDLYHGIQQGDNGQSMVLGGFDGEGNSMYNELSQMCMQASLELSVIDPKINLRVGKNTPDELYEFGTLLTKQGLGFPQYCNDDVVVPGLIKLGYSREDALNYTVAACWEYIIPGCGADTPNIETMDFPAVINEVILSDLSNCADFEALMDCVKKKIASECERIAKSRIDCEFTMSPLLSVFMTGCTESLTDLWRGGTRYQNFGCHGAGIANATDALAAVKKNIFDEKTIEKETLLAALKSNFDGYDEIRHLLKCSPKMGNNDEYADDIASALMQVFADNMNGRDNGHGGIWRAGTGSAHDYLMRGKKCPPTADGRKSGEPYSSSFSPSLDVKTSGILSVLQSFTKFDMTEIINGGPLTLEIHDTVLRNDIGIKKTAMLIKAFISLGGHQLQLNSINRDRLLDAQKHPEKYPGLITRVWGWSGYFNELDVEFQNHIIRRTEYLV